MSSDWLSVTDSEVVMPWIIDIDGFFRKSVENRMLADNMTKEATIQFSIMQSVF